MESSPSMLLFFEILRRHDFSKAEPASALGFTRCWADLAQRVLAAHRAQTGREVRLPRNLLPEVFETYLNSGPNGLAAYTPALNDSLAQLAWNLAAWLAPQFDLTDPLATSYQVFVRPEGAYTITLFGPPGSPLPPPFKLLAAQPLEPVLEQAQGRPVAVIGHYDVHGISMLALTLRYLRRHGFNTVDCALSFEWTGDIGKLWKRAVPKTVQHEKEYALVFLLDCSIHSRKPEHTLKAVERLSKAPHSRLVLIDHHPDTFTLAPELMHPQLDLLLTDIPGCGLVDTWNGPERELMLLGAIGDKVPEVCAAYPEDGSQSRLLHEANSAFHRRAIHFSPTPEHFKQAGEYPLRPLWEALADGEPPSAELDERLYGALSPPPAPSTPETEACGSLLCITQPLAEVGRQWYGLLERLMRKHGLAYAMAMRVLDGKHANILLLTQWDATHLPPVRLFIPDSYGPHLLGHPGATWADFPLDLALPFLRTVVARLNDFMGTPAGFDGIEEKLDKAFIAPNQFR